MVEEAQHAAPVIGMAGELAKLVAILTVKPDGISPSVILVAPTGSGKTSLVRRLAQEVFRARRGERDPLPVRELFELELSVLLAGTSYRGRLEQRYLAMQQACMEKEGRYLFIDEIHTMAQMGSNGGGLPWLETIKLHMQNGSLRLIGATTPVESNIRLGTDSALTRRFFRFDVDPFTHAETVEILEYSVARFDGVHVTCERGAIEDVAALTHLAVAQPGLGKKALVDLATQKLAQQPGASVFITRSDVRAYTARNALQGPSSDRIAPIIAATRDVFLDCLTMVDEVAQVIAKEWQKCPWNSSRQLWAPAAN